MMTGKEPSADHAKALDQYYVLLVDHGYNASTFSARVTASTNADLYCAITAAIATLTGELHGGAPSQVQDALVDVGTPDKAEQWVRDLLKRKGRLMGMGHREYKVRDPRAKHLEETAKRLNNGGGIVRGRARARRRVEQGARTKRSRRRASMRTSTSTPRRRSARSASRATSTPVCSRARAWPAGARTCSSSTPTTA